MDSIAELQRQEFLRPDDTVLMARHFWALVHGVAMLAIDGQLCESGEVEELTRYALERLRTGIAAHP